MDEDKNIYWRDDEVLPPGYCREMMRPTLIAECECQERDNTSAWAASIKRADIPDVFANTWCTGFEIYDNVCMNTLREILE